MATIEGTGITVAGFVMMERGGDSIDTLMQIFPSLTREKADEAIRYNDEHPDEVEKNIERLINPLHYQNVYSYHSLNGNKIKKPTNRFEGANENLYHRIKFYYGESKSAGYNGSRDGNRKSSNGNHGNGVRKH